MSDDFDFDELAGKSKEEAFVIFEKAMRKIYNLEKKEDRNIYTTDGYNYNGYYSPEHNYANKMIAFIDEHEIDNNISTDFIQFEEQYFIQGFTYFQGKMDRLAVQFQLRKNLYGNGTLIYIAKNYKEEISENLTLIEKIVNQANIDTYKKDNIHKQITNLRNVINSEKTNLEHFILGCHKVTKAVGEAGNHIEPLMKQIEKLKDFFWKCSDFIPLLPKQTEPRKKIEYVEKAVALEDDIPF